MKNYVLLAFTLLITFSCKKDTVNTDSPVEEPAGNGRLTVAFKGVVDSQDLIIGNSYKTPVGDTFAVNLFKYYISNVVLTTADGTKYNESESYHLISHSSTGTPSFVISNIPKGSYKSISYTIGVDSARNVSGAQDFDLSPSKGMYWAWLGYIMLKIEGTSPQAVNNAGTFGFHIGGFSGVDNVLKYQTILFPQNIQVESTKSPKLTLKTNVNEIFVNPTNISLFFNADVTTPGTKAVEIANNYADMISFESITP